MGTCHRAAVPPTPRGLGIIIGVLWPKSCCRRALQRSRLNVDVPALLVAALVVLLTGCTPESGTTLPRGAILISVDPLRADRLGLYGHPRPTSPFLDELARQAVVFDNAIVQVPGTLPSHMSIFTGLFPGEHGVRPPDDSLSPAIPTLPEVFQSHGFRTAGFTEGGFVSGRFGFARGFEHFDDSAAKIPTDVEDTLARGIEFLSGLDRHERFFLLLHTYCVHDNYITNLPNTPLNQRS